MPLDTLDSITASAWGSAMRQRQSTAQRLSTAATAFQETLEALGLTETSGELADSAAFGRRAALVAVADVLWRRHLGTLLDTPQVQQLLGGRTRQAVSDLVRRRRLLALPSESGRLLFPAFQFTTAGRPHPLLPELLALFADAGVDAHTTASWFVTPKALLERRTPAEWLAASGDPARLKETARRTTARLRQ